MSTNCLLCWCLGIYSYLNNNNCIDYGGGGGGGYGGVGSSRDLGLLICTDKVLATKTSYQQQQNRIFRAVHENCRLLACVNKNSIIFFFVRYFN